MDAPKLVPIESFVEVVYIMEAKESGSRVLISSARKPISYINLCKRYLQEHGEVHLSALGVAIASLVTVAELLKAKELAVEKKVQTMLETTQDESSKSRQKPKLIVHLVKSDKFDEIYAAEQEAAKVAAAAKAEAAAAAGDTKEGTPDVDGES